MTNITIGKKGEELACEYLVKQGYKILDMNKRFSRICEIDIIALDKNTLVSRKILLCTKPLKQSSPQKGTQSGHGTGGKLYYQIQ